METKLKYTNFSSEQIYKFCTARIDNRGNPAVLSSLSICMFCYLSMNMNLKTGEIHPTKMSLIHDNLKIDLKHCYRVVDQLYRGGLFFYKSSEYGTLRGTLYGHAKLSRRLKYIDYAKKQGIKVIPHKSPFGFGLEYTGFSIEDLKAFRFAREIKRAGKEIQYPISPSAMCMYLIFCLNRDLETHDMKPMDEDVLGEMLEIRPRWIGYALGELRECELLEKFEEARIIKGHLPNMAKLPEIMANSRKERDKRQAKKAIAEMQKMVEEVDVDEK